MEAFGAARQTQGCEKEPTMNGESGAVPPQPEDDERRRFRRLAAGVHVIFHGVPQRREEREYLKALAEDVSLGGMFLATRHTLPVGTTVEVEFHPRDEHDNPVSAKAMVCWRRRWRQP